MDVALLDGALVHHVAGNARNRIWMFAAAACCLATSFNSKAKSQPSTSTPLVLGASLPVPMARLELGRDLRHVADAHRRIDSADVNHAAGFDAVQPSVAVKRRGVGEF